MPAGLSLPRFEDGRPVPGPAAGADGRNASRERFRAGRRHCVWHMFLAHTPQAIGITAVVATPIRVDAERAPQMYSA
ncbi:hypothetical protein GCM10010497_63090 [Streptomyces cinereoruber]|uniref:IclR-ED domain-containing protein n=1 Tax=Streptomyces cinereoruber TaxID=67260 RepID=A0AAV4KRF1_9ACTN|nr:hypothetical protein GCM10010497_63090 [Streptomyces cinereoruber]